MGKIKSFGFFIAAGLILIGTSLVISHFSSFSLPQLAKNAGRKIENKLGICEPAINKLLSENNAANKEEFYALFKKEKIGLYLFTGDSLLFWNNAQIPFSDSILKQQKNEGMVTLRQGYYLYKKQKQGEKTACALCLIKSKYDLQNNHLKNDFTGWINIPKGVELITKTGTGTDVEINGTKLFSLKGDETLYNNKSLNTICILLFLSGVFIFFISMLLFFKKKNTLPALLLNVLPLVLIKLLMIGSIIPNFLSATYLYDLNVFANAQSVLNFSLADIIFNAGALLYISVLFYLHFTAFNSRAEKNIKLFLLFALAFLTVWQFNHSIKSLVSNSTLSYDFLNIFNIKPAAIVSLLALVFNAITLFITLYKACSYFNKMWWRSFLEFTACSLFICVLLNLVSPNDTVFQSYWLILFSTALFGLVKLQYQKFSLGLGLLIAVMSATTAGFFTHYIEKNQLQDLKIEKDKLIERRDTYLENEFVTLPGKIEKDNNLQAIVNLLPETKKEVGALLKQKYFGGYFNTYNVEFSLFDKDCHPLLEPSDPILLNEGFFEERIKNLSDSTLAKELFFVEKYKKNTQYISKIKLQDKNLYILLEPKQFEELGSFPDLLLDQSQQKQDKQKNFSYAVYRSDQKTNKYSGECNYPFYFIDSVALSKSIPEFVHHYFTSDDGAKIIISEKTKNWNYYFTYNSYLFLFFSIISFFCYYVYTLFFTANFKTSSLTRRIQTIIILLLLLAMSAVGITSGSLVTRQFEGDNVKQLQEKTQTIISELNDQFKADELFSTSQKEQINLKLQEFAHLYSSDISLFDNRGALFTTSQPKLYELGLADSLSNPEAYFKLKENQTSSWYVYEKAGTLDYLSLYTPVFNENKTLIGFINLPYFAKQSDLTNELSSIISALINVYIILFIISILAGLILAGYITKPLRLIQRQIANITLGTQNETLKWESNDEVGKLVNEYNNMLLKLEHSANLLAQSERESAWREMAKQVAHEIKNPLTPMKLNLQYLQHVMKNSPADFNEKFEKASASIIEQIDTLAAIATEFSNFARLPGTQLKQINLLEIIHSSVNLFEQEKNSSIKVNIQFPEMPVTGDKEQALRIFNNVIKNAIHATQEVKDPEIKITAEETPETYIVKITDNGCGIAEEMKDKIFTPNFTTKTTGSGLGLAMVKSIVSNFGGKIWFKSEKNKGTEFFIEFRKS